LVPLAVARLDREPLAEGDFYPGDLLAAVLRVPAEYWTAHPGQRRRLRAVLVAVDGGRARRRVACRHRIVPGVNSADTLPDIDVVA
jgi:hypothetical protein